MYWAAIMSDLVQAPTRLANNAGAWPRVRRRGFKHSRPQAFYLDNSGHSLAVAEGFEPYSGGAGQGPEPSLDLRRCDLAR